MPMLEHFLNVNCSKTKLKPSGHQICVSILLHIGTIMNFWGNHETICFERLILVYGVILLNRSFSYLC